MRRAEERKKGRKIDELSEIPKQFNALTTPPPQIIKKSYEYPAVLRTKETCLKGEARM